MTEYSQLTLDVTRRLSKAEKKEYGFFVTPPSITDRLLSRVKSIYSNTFTTILEPSCGTCEILSAVSKIYDKSMVDGVEWNKTVYDSIKSLETDRIHLIHEDFLKYNKPETYDLVVGNPPYFVCQKEQVPPEYRPLITGRPNIFTIFILHALTQLKPSGILAFVLPKSFLNAAYYEEVRMFINKTCIIKDLLDFEDCNDFLETQQATFGLIVEKKSGVLTEEQSVSPFSAKLGDNNIFVTNPESFSRLIQNSTTLKSLGYSVKTGSIVWNEKKKDLTDYSTKTLLIYNSNVVGNKIEIKTFSNNEKKQFINLPGISTNGMVVNRGNGNSVYKLSYAFVDSSRPYLVENHLNVITHPTNQDFSGIIKSFQDPRTTEFLKTFIGNGALSKTELETMLPIYL
jgi:adenine-specific DNA-methyltransferase